MADQKKCRVCGADIIDSRSDAVYCSGACRQQALRDRSKTEALVTVGVISAPVTSFSTTAGAFGQIGSATIELSALRGEPARDASGHTSVTLSVAGDVLWAGALRRITRASSSMIRLECAGPESYLAEQRWSTNTWEHCSIEQFIQAAAQRAGMPSLPSDEPLDARVLGSYLDINGNRSALEVLLAASRECGYDFGIRDGVLTFGPVKMAEPRTIAASNVVLTRYGSPERFGIVIRSRLPALLGGANRKVLTTGCLGDIPAGLPVYVITVDDRRQPETDQLAETLAREIAAGVVHVSADTDDAALMPGMPIRIEATSDVISRVVRVRHEFNTERGLSTRFEAMHLPSPPAVPALRPGVMAARSVCGWAA